MVDLKWSADGLVSFQDEGHIYRMGDKILTGVTTFIHRFTEEFDTERIATNYALKHNLNKAEVIAGWKQEGDYSTEQGGHVHKVLEDVFNTGVLDEDIRYPKQKTAIKFVKDLFFTGRLIPVASEIVVHNGVIASQIDKIVKNPAGDHFILDYKTNKRIERYSFRDRRMKAPFQKYMDCNFYHYSLQVGIYRKLCKEYDIKDVFIIHFGEENYEIIKPVPIIIPDYILTAA